MKAANLHPGTVIGGDYEITSLLKAGGMGAIYLCRQLSTDRQRAIKLMHPDLVATPELLRRFELEARIGARISSRHLVEVLAAGTHFVDLGAKRLALPWMVMELLSGRDLGEHLREKGRMERDEVISLISQLGDALAAAHDAGVVHRDLKPENIFLSMGRPNEPPFVKLLDLGIAKLLSQTLTTHTQMLGTPLWMAPEQSQSGSAIVPATDVWSLGLLVFRMLTGRNYWLAAEKPKVSLSDLLPEVLSGPLPKASTRARHYGESLPASFDRWFSRCVHRNVAERFPHARIAISELLSVLRSTHKEEVLFGRYRIRETLFADPLGVVYRAEELGADTPCRLRVLTEHAQDCNELQGSSIAEILKNQTKLPLIPGIGQVRHVEVSGPSRYLELSPFDGVPISTLVGQGFSPSVVLSIAQKVAATLARAHEWGFCHRGISPQNVLLAEGTNEVEILDLGLSYEFATWSRKATGASAATVVESGYLPFFAFASPEDDKGPPADVWAFAHLVFYLLVGKTYFKEAQAESGALFPLLSAILRGTTQAASLRAEELGRPLPTTLEAARFDTWFARASASVPHKRYPTISEAMAALEVVLRGTPAPMHHKSTERLGLSAHPFATAIAKPRRDPLLAGLWRMSLGILSVFLVLVGLVLLQTCGGS